MRSIFERVRDAHNHILVFLLFTGCLAVLLYMYPREGQFKYEYAEGQVWKYEDLFAPYDLRVARLPQEVDAEQEQIRKEVAPIYQRIDSIPWVQSQRLAAAAQIEWRSKDEGFFKELLKGGRADSVRIWRNIEVGETILEDLFHSGIINLDPLHEDLPVDAEIRIAEKAYVTSFKRSDVYSLSEAAEFVRSSLEKQKGKVDAEWLQPLIEQALVYNLIFDADATTRFLQGRLNAVQRFSGELKAGELIVRKGQQIGREELRKLKSLESVSQSEAASGRGWWIILLGQALLISLGLIAMGMIIRMLEPEILEAPSRVTFLLVLVLIMALTVKIALEVNALSIYLAPLCILPIVLRTFYDARIAILLHVVNVFMLSFIVPSAFEFVFLQIFAGILLVYGMRSLAKRSHFFNAAVVIFMSYSATYLGLNIIQEGSFEGIHWTNYAWFGGNAMLSMLAFPLIYFFERSFGLISEVRLLEISDSNNRLLRDLSEKAPGTFQHTIQVSNLAEEAIRAIGGNVLLVRAGALYHDIGKMEAPQYFTENQVGVNLHDEMSHQESAKMIIHHVIKGIELARKHRLPEEIIDFIRTHHGTTRTEYFYRSEVELKGKQAVDPADFTYPGPRPFNRETAVLMMADAVEAASRSLSDYSEENLKALIEGLISHQQTMGQFENASITFKEISTVKKVFLRKLKNIYHARIAYPESKD